MKKRVSFPIKDTKLFKEMASVIPNGVVIVNSKGEIMFFNKAAENIFQIPTEKAINRFAFIPNTNFFFFSSDPMRAMSTSTSSFESGAGVVESEPTNPVTRGVLRTTYH